MLGASFDTPEENKVFADTEQFGYRLLADVDRTVGSQYEVTRSPDDERANYTQRIAYLIDPDGIIRKAYEVTDVDGFADRDPGRPALSAFRLIRGDPRKRGQRPGQLPGPPPGPAAGRGQERHQLADIGRDRRPVAGREPVAVADVQIVARIPAVEEDGDGPFGQTPAEADRVDRAQPGVGDQDRLVGPRGRR